MPTLLFRKDEPLTGRAIVRPQRILLVLTSLESVPESLRLGRFTAEMTADKNVTVHVMAFIRDVPDSERGRAASCALTLLHTFADDLGKYPARFSVIFDSLPWPFVTSSASGADDATLPFLALVTPVRVLTATSGCEIQKTRWLRDALDTLF
jgi:hypothetical protein